MRGYLERRRALIEGEAPGVPAARLLAGLTDEAVSDLAEAASSRLGGLWAVVALGGYGAGRLLPSSDVDLLLLAEETGPPLRAAAGDVFYPLWDAGLKVGHQVRTRREHLLACRADVETLTSSLTGRVIAGDREYGSRVLSEVAADACGRRKRVLPRLAARVRAGSPYVLEPDLKEGAGGQRDIDEIRWTETLLGGGRLSRALDDALQTLTTARWELQSAGLGNSMTLEAAERLEMTDAQRVQDAMCEVADALDRVRARAARVSARRADGGGSFGGEDVLLTPARLFAAIDGGRTEALQRAAWRGELEALVPGIRALMPLRRPALSHTLTVGAHCIECACRIVPLSAEDPALARSLDEAGDLRALRLAALAHDAGKAVPGAGHAQRGAAAALRVAEACGLAAEEARFAARLVGLHLLLPAAALRTDAADSEAVAGLAETVGDARTLAALHVLSAADAAATGPGAWSAWHSALLAGLVGGIRAQLSGDSGRPAGHVLDEVRSLIGERGKLASDWLSAAPARYLSSTPAARIAEDAELVGTSLGRGVAAPPSLRVSPGAADGSWVLTAAARDRPGLLAALAGVLALAGLDVLAASASVWGGMAVHSFTVRSATLAPVSHEVWMKADRLLEAAWRGRLSLDARLAEHRSHYRRSGLAAVPVSVRFDTSDPGATLVEVRAPDRVGLLYEMAASMAESGLRVVWANAVVQDGVARDAFRVTAPGEAHREPGVLGHVSMRIRERLAEE